MAFTDKEREREYKREWQRAQGPGYRSEYKKAWLAAHPDYIKNWHAEHPGKQNEYAKRWALNNPETYRPYQRAKLRRHGMKQRDAIKLQVMTYYGGGRAACVTCQVADIDVLTIDHINNDGYLARREDRSKGAGSHFYKILVASGFPPGFQTLCSNCNLKKHILHARAQARQRAEQK